MEEEDPVKEPENKLLKERRQILGKFFLDGGFSFFFSLELFEDKDNCIYSF